MNIKEAKTRFLEYVEIERGRSLKTVENYDHYLSTFIEQTKVVEISEVTYEHVRKFRLWLNRQPGQFVLGQSRTTLKKKTQNYYLIALRAFLKYLMKLGHQVLTPEAIELAKVESREIDFLTPAELARILATPDLSTLGGLRDRAFLETFFSTGLRVAELCSLNQDIDLSRDEYTIRGKGDKMR
jgi:site-specific recombinase XerD